MSLKTHCKHGHEFTDENTYMHDGERHCRVCRRECSKDFAKLDPYGSAYRSRIKSQMRSRYGINSIEERDAILAAQGGGCAVCHRTDCTWGKGFNNTWHIDHDHSKPKTHRGILCGYCNLALGRLEPHFQTVLTYLNQYQ
jgi:hypothetical protein